MQNTQSVQEMQEMQEMQDVKEKQEKSFSQFNLSPKMLKSLQRMNFLYPTEVQEKSIGQALKKRDLTVQAPTGTGKTAAFGIPLIENLTSNESFQALVLCPTRELVVQTSDVLRKIVGGRKHVQVVSVFGGAPFIKQLRALKQSPQIIVATPGRLLDHLNRKSIQLRNIKTFVIDEADRMLDMGFRDDLNAILSQTPPKRQTMLFSATMSKEVLKIAKSYQNFPVNIVIEKPPASESQIEQFYMETKGKDKFTAMMDILKERESSLSLVFVNTKIKTEEVAELLRKEGKKAAFLHGDMRQNERDKVMRMYRTKKISVLVATDVAARGIDVLDTDTVINYDLPMETESYVHRVGRTGRASNSGHAYTLVCPSEIRKLKDISKKTGMYIKFMKNPSAPAKSFQGPQKFNKRKAYKKRSA